MACGGPDDGTWRPRTTGTTGTPPGTPGGTTSTGSTTDSTAPPTVCDAVPAGPRPSTHVPLAMEEDFDFDSDGYALVQDGAAVIGRNRYGDQKLVSATASWDPSGIQVLSTGGVVVGAQDEGTVKVVNPLTGGTVVAASGLVQPNGIEIGSDDRIYVSEFTFNGRVRWFDLAGGSGIVAAGLTMPNGIVLSPDEQTLYIGGQAPGTGNGAILAVDRLGPDDWDGAGVRVVWENPPGDFDGVEVDICGNIYSVEYMTGRVFRVRPDGTGLEMLADLDDPDPWWVEFNALRWGNGVGGWDPEVLYVTDRNLLFEVEIGVPGKPSPSSVWVP